MRCWLDDKNIFSAVSMPKGLKIEHYKADAIYEYYHERREKSLEYEYTVNSVDSYTINDTKYSHVKFYIDKNLKIVKFIGKVATKYFDDKEIRDLMKKSNIVLKSKK